MRFGRVAALSALVALAGAGALAAPEKGPGLAEVRARIAALPGLEERSARDGEIPADGRGAPVLRALQVDGAPYPCGTPAYGELLRLLPGLPAPRRDALLRLARPPRLAGQREHLSADGAFLVRYTTDSTSPDAVPASDHDADGVPDAVEEVARLAAAARVEIAERLGWADPVREPPYEIILAGLPGPRSTLLPVLGAPGEAVGSRMVLDPSLLSGDALLGEVAHQIAHASQWSVSAVEEGWWDEAAAEWAAFQVSRDLSRVRPWLERRARSREEGLRSDNLGLLRGAFQFVLYLEARGGPGLIRDIGRELGEVPGPNVVPALDAQLLAATGLSLAEHVRLYHLWNLATGPADTGRHYRNGSALPPPDADEVRARYPVRQAESARAPRGFGTNVLRFPAEGVEGGLRISFDGDRSVPWAVDLAGEMPGGGFERVPVELDEAGRGSATVPAGRYASVLMVVTNLDPDPERTGVYAVEAEPVAGWPFRLSGVEARDDRGQVLLGWTSLEERDLYGWRVLRAESPGGPYEPLNAVPVPAVGALGLPIEYSYLDAATVPGTRYWYRVEGLTLQGIPVPAGEEVSAVSLPLLTPQAILPEAPL